MKHSDKNEERLINELTDLQNKLAALLQGKYSMREWREKPTHGRARRPGKPAGCCGSEPVEQLLQKEIARRTEVEQALAEQLRFLQRLAVYFHGMDNHKHSEEGDLLAAVTLYSPVGKFIVQDGRFRYINPRFLEYTGYSAKELVGRNTLTFVHPADRDQVKEKAVAMLKGKGHSPYEYRFIHKSGEIRWVMEGVTSVRYRGKQAVLGNFMDVTEQRRAREELFKEKERLAVTLNSIGDAVIAVDMAGRVTLMNPVAESLTGWSRAEALGRPLEEVFVIMNENTREPAENPVQKVLLLGEVVGLANHTILIARDGSERSIADSAAPIKNASGNILGVILVFRDVTDKRQWTKALQKSEERFRNMAENAWDVIFRIGLDPKVKFEYVSPAVTIVSGYAPDEFYADPSLGLKIVHPEDRNLLTGLLSGDFDYTKTITLRWVRKDGYQVWTEQRNVPVYDENGRLVALEGIGRDITERKLAEELLHRETAALNASMDGMAVFSREEKLIYMNEAYLRIFGYDDPGELVGQGWKNLCNQFDAEEIKKTIRPALDRKGYWRGEIIGKKKDGTKFHLELSLTGVEGGGFVCVARDADERKRMEDQLQYLSLHDILTGAYNRAFFEQEMRRLANGSHNPVGIIACDVDGLKLVNDTLGHDAGDRLLVAAAGVIRKHFRACDVVARIGGDEFAVLLPSSGNAAVQNACQRIKNAVDLYNAGSPEIPLSLSIGYAVSNDKPVNMNDLFKEADNNMYREKLHRSRSARSAIVKTLMKALKARDHITEDHADRLQDLVVALARALDFSERRIADLRLLARFHDIGKVGIPDRILFKQGPLTDEETMEMHRHCEIGYRIAQSAPDLTLIADWILKHHEWWNGSGYPLGIKGEEIPLECRILAVADAYDAMTSERPYRRAMSHKQAVEELGKFAGSQFDPALVQIFIRVLEAPGTKVGARWRELRESG